MQLSKSHCSSLSQAVLMYVPVRLLIHVHALEFIMSYKLQLLNSSGGFLRVLAETYTPSPGLQFSSSHGHLVNYPSTHVKHQWFLYSLEQREDLNEIINIPSMAPTCAPGHSNPFSTPSKPGRKKQQKDGSTERMSVWEGAAWHTDDPGNAWKVRGSSDCQREARRFSADYQRKKKREPELSWAEPSSARQLADITENMSVRSGQSRSGGQ